MFVMHVYIVIACIHPNMMTSSNGNIFRVTGPLLGGIHRSPVDSLTQRPVTPSFDVFFNLHVNKQLWKNRDPGDLRRHRAHYDVHVIQARYMCIAHKICIRFLYGGAITSVLSGFVWAIHPYSSGLFQRYWGDPKITSLLARESWGDDNLSPIFNQVAAQYLCWYSVVYHNIFRKFSKNTLKSLGPRDAYMRRQHRP